MNKHNNELHLFIIWQKARILENDLIDKIADKFDILEIYDIKWSKKMFSKNLTRFYGTNLPKNSSKEKHVGNGSFLLLIVLDKTPKYEVRNTSKGKSVVNINTFDLKEQLRHMTGGGHKIHATNNQTETNHDISLLLGISSADFLAQHVNYNGSIKYLKQDLIGSNGWKNLKEFFYILNNTINYVVLRNFNCLPDMAYEDEHGDIDILCDNLENLCFITNATKIYRQPFRVHFYVLINKQKVKFDFRFIGDGYYDSNFQKNILGNKILHKNCFYIPNEEHYFYSLLYHALLHKRFISDDYFHKIKSSSNNLKNISEIKNKIQLSQILKQYLLSENINITKPLDHSVYFNSLDIRLSDLTNHISQKHGFENIEPFLEQKWKKDVFNVSYLVATKQNKKFFIKLSDKNNGVMQREALVLEALEKTPINTPTLITHFEFENFYVMITEFIEGKQLNDCLEQIKENQEQTKLVIKSLEKILITLHNNKYLHRDITPHNLLITSNAVFLIDFAFLVSLDNNKFPELSFIQQNIKAIGGLGEEYKYRKYVWDDAYSCKRIITLLGSKTTSKAINDKVGNVRLKYVVIRNIFSIFLYKILLCNKIKNVFIIKKKYKILKNFNKNKLLSFIIIFITKLTCCFIPIKKYRLKVRNHFKELNSQINKQDVINNQQNEIKIINIT